MRLWAHVGCVLGLKEIESLTSEKWDVYQSLSEKEKRKDIFFACTDTYEYSERDRRKC